MMAAPLRLAAALMILPALAGCMTPRAHPKPSQAVLEARARAATPLAATCPQTPLAELSPALVGFAFGGADLPNVGGEPLAQIPTWLACHPAVAAVIKPDADTHGTAAEQDALARRRALAVQAWLESNGVSAARVRILARGGAEPAGEHLTILAEGRRW